MNEFEPARSACCNALFGNDRDDPRWPACSSCGKRHIAPWAGLRVLDTHE